MSNSQCWKPIAGLRLWLWQSDRLVDLLLTDVEIPGMDGIELLRSMRAQRPERKVILISGSATPDTVEGGPLLSKPFTVFENVSSGRSGTLTQSPVGRILAYTAVNTEIVR